MIGLLTAFFLFHGDAEWYWWALWSVLALANVVNFVRNH